jgi:hypothetical protein
MTTIHIDKNVYPINVEKDVFTYLVFRHWIKKSTSDDIETKEQALDEIFRLARIGYVPAITHVGLLYLIMGRKYNELNFYLLGKRLTIMASYFGNEDADKNLDIFGEVLDIEDDGRHLQYPNPGGPPLEARIEFFSD